MLSLFFNKSTQKSSKIKLRSGESFLVFSLMDVWVLKETILDRQYELVGVSLEDGWTVLDIGAALGDYSVWAAKQTPHGRLIAVEPYPPSVELLRTNLENNQVSNVEVFAGAVSAHSGTTTMQVAGRVVQNSTAASGKSEHVVEVKTISLETLFKQFAIQKCDYLKMDCEGGEYEILFSASKETLARIDRICMEIHDGMTDHDHHEMIRFLEANGYVTRLTPNPVHQELAYLYAEKSGLKKERS
jgi:FkbM family methyltransferase